MRKLIFLMLILLACSYLQFGGQIRPKIGLLSFSIDTFDEEAEKIRKNLKPIIDIITEELYENFEIVEKFSEQITYPDIEAPEVTIAPVLEPQINKKLESFSKDLDGLLFGQFYQEDNLILVSRLYLPMHKYPALSKENRIISAPEVEIATTDLNPEILKKHTITSIKRLIEEIREKSPGILKRVEGKDLKGVIYKDRVRELPQKKSITIELKETDNKVKKPDNKVEIVKRSQIKINSEGEKNSKEAIREKKELPYKTRDTYDLKKSDDKAVTSDDGIQQLTAKQVYQMIEDNEFYCEIIEGSQFHSEGLSGIKRPEAGVFKDKRVVRVIYKNNGYIRTESENKEQGKKDGNVVLNWRLIELKPYSFSAAEAYIKDLNQSNKKEFSKWRIPTILELFSIISGNTKNHFPQAFKHFPKDKDLIFWTSTPVKKEGTVLDYDKMNQAYFVVRSTYNRSMDFFSISFAYYNIDGNQPREAFLLPVCSDKDKVYTYLNLPEGKAEKDQLGGFVSNTQKSITHTKMSENGIPGFDDILSSPPTIKKYANREKKYHPKKIKIALFPYYWIGMLGETEERELSHINDEIEKVLNIQKEEFKGKFICDLEIIKKIIFNDSDSIMMVILFNLMSDNKCDMNEIKQKIMIPENIDIIVTGEKAIDAGTGIHTWKSYIIDGRNNAIYKKFFVSNDKKIYQELMDYVVSVVKKIISSPYQ